MQWNYYYSVSDVRDNARTVATTVILAFLVFMLLSMFDGVIAVILLEVALFGSCVLNVATIRFDMLGRFDAVVEVCSHPAETRSYGLIRVLYFAARVCYGLALGFLVGLVSFSGEAVRLNNVLAAFASVVFAVCICCILLTSAKSRSNVAFVVALPFFLAAQAFIVFYPGLLTSPLGLFAALSELAWITQNIFQLPTYRRMTGMNAGAFAFVDYGCQMVPFYLCAWFVMKLGTPVDLRGSLAYASILSGFLFVVIVVTASAAMARHAVRYLPWGGGSVEREQPVF